MVTSSFFEPVLAAFSWAPPWLTNLAIVAGALTAALVVYGLAVRAVERELTSTTDFTRSLFVRTYGPGRLAICVGALTWVVEVAPLTARAAAAMEHFLLIAFVVLCGWAAMTAIDIGAAVYIAHEHTAVRDARLARKHITEVSILRRVVKSLVAVLTAGAILSTIPGVKQFGVSLLAAGGAASIVLGLALQPVLTNLLAGIQIALTQPIRIDDAVKIGGEFGHVEDINATYVVVRLWDLRRLIVPLRYFLTEPFQNWTRKSPAMIGAVMLRVDQRIPVARLRAQLGEILRACDLWDSKSNELQVTDVLERTTEIRCLISARNPTDLTALTAHVREAMLTYLQADFPEFLPRNGGEPSPARGDGVAAPTRQARSRPSRGSAGTPAPSGRARARPR